MNQEMQNALAFYQPEPQGDYSWFESKGLWLWETLKGDFHDDPSVSQIATGTVISMIPLVDQICDVRDLIANCQKIKEGDGADIAQWAGLGFTLVGLFPVLGSLGKGAAKVVFFYVKRSVNLHLASKAAADAAKIAVEVLESAIPLLDKYWADPRVRKALEQLKIHDPFLFLAGKFDHLKSVLTVERLLKSMDELMGVARRLFDWVIRYAPEAVVEKVEAMWHLLVSVREMAREGLGGALETMSASLEAMANRLRVESDNAYRARVGVGGQNTHVLANRDAAQLELFERKKPDWVDKTEDVAFPALEGFSNDLLKYVGRGWPDISETSTSPGLRGAFGTFDKSLRASEVMPGERLFRVLDPNSGDNRICWMRESEFKLLGSKGQWRKDFAVWKSWNENGEYVIYTVPPGKPLKVWEGRVGTQELEGNEQYKLVGGRSQIVLDTRDLDHGHVSSRKKTGWGYDDGGAFRDLDPENPYLGLPQLTHNWSMPETK